MERIERTRAIYVQEFFDPGADIFLRVPELRSIRRRSFSHLASEIVRQRVGQNEITVSQALHKRAGSESVRAVIGKIGFADHKQTGQIAHQIVIDPKTAHCVMDSRVNSHGHFVCVFAGDLFVDFKQISVALANYVFAQALDRIGKIEVDAAPTWAYAAALIANFLRCA